MWIWTAGAIVLLGAVNWLWYYYNITRVQKQLVSRKRIGENDFRSENFDELTAKPKIAETVYQILGREVPIDVTLISLDDNLVDLKIFLYDSGDASSFVNKIEKTFDIIFDEDELERVKSLRDIISLVNQCLNRKKSHADL